jgi:hypothetical protein
MAPVWSQSSSTQISPTCDESFNAQQIAGDECRLRFAASASLSFPFGGVDMTKRPTFSFVTVLAGLIGVGAVLWFWSYTSRHIIPAQPWATPAPDEAPTLQDRIDITEAAFRYMCQPKAASEEVSHQINLVHGVYFLAVGASNDPPTQLLERLRDLPAPVRPISAGEWRDAFIFDRGSGARGAAFYVRRIRMSRLDEAQVEVAIHPGGVRSASWYSYCVSRENGKWRVTGERLRGIA